MNRTRKPFLIVALFAEHEDVRATHGSDQCFINSDTWCAADDLGEGRPREAHLLVQRIERGRARDERVSRTDVEDALSSSCEEGAVLRRLIVNANPAATPFEHAVQRG